MPVTLSSQAKLSNSPVTFPRGARSVKPKRPGRRPALLGNEPRITRVRPGTGYAVASADIADEESRQSIKNRRGRRSPLSGPSA
jgi:hypothetical protein